MCIYSENGNKVLLNKINRYESYKTQFYVQYNTNVVSTDELNTFDVIFLYWKL